MAKKVSGVSDRAKELVAKIYELQERAKKLLEQAEQLSAETTLDKKTAARAKQLTAGLKVLILDMRPSKKMES